MTERRCAPPISKVESVTYRMGVHAPDSVSCQRENLSSIQGSKLTLANSQNASDFDNLRVRKISTSKRLRVRIIHVSQTKRNNLLVVSPVC